MGCAENKRGERKMGRGLGPGVIGFGFKPGRVKRGYIRVVRPIFHSFFINISLSSPYLRANALFSLLSLFIFSGGEVGGGKGFRRGGRRVIAAAPPRRS